MRVTDGAFLQRFLAGLRSSRADLAEAVDRIADHKRVRVASDDPVGAHQSLALRGRAVRLEGFVRTARLARFDLSTADAVLAEAVQLVTSARNEAMAGASNIGDDANAIRADAVDSLRERLIRLANTAQNGRYLFAGTATLTVPFDDAGSYAGNDDAVLAPLDADQEVAVTLSGREVFQGPDDLFRVLDDLADALRNGDTAAIGDAVPRLRRQIDHLASMRAATGQRMNAIDSVTARHDDDLVRVRQRISELEDVVLEEAALRLGAADTRFQALSGTAARVLGRSLFDFLG